TLLSGVWTLRPDADSLTFKVPEKSSQSVILWMQHEDQPDEKPRWVMLVSGEESPAIALARPALINLPSWMMPAGIVGISLIAGGMLLRRPRIVSQGA
ncbi:MAG: hypothetical protein WCN98_17595, partial [Verrucomicrobiaceae bacterium]